VIRQRRYNLDTKNPNAPDDDYRDPDELLAEYLSAAAKVHETRESLKVQLTSALESALLAEERA
jgi:type I restriction enzyme M protein